MSRLHPLTPMTAKGHAKDLLRELVDRHGEIGPMVATMAHSPAMLSGYLALSRSMKRAKLSRHVSELMSIALQARIGCGLCLRAHEETALQLGIDADEIERAKAGTSNRAEHAAAVSFGLKILAEPSRISDRDLDQLRLRGFSDREVADMVGLVALNLLTGAFNLTAGVGPQTTR